MKSSLSGNFQFIIKSKALIQTIFLLLFNGFGRKSLELILLNAQNKNYKRLSKLFRNNETIDLDNESFSTKKHSKIWVCWFQGMNNAPDIVKSCYESQIRLEGKEVVLIDNENFKNYTNFPKHIIDKWESGLIPPAHFSDLLRVELLCEHGGIWLDATIYCSEKYLPKYLEESWFFCFQKLKPGSQGSSLLVSSWALSSVKNNPILTLLRSVLYEYWERKNNLADYFMFHHLLSFILQCNPALKNHIKPSCNSIPQILLTKLNEEFDSEMFEHITSLSLIHKTTYRNIDITRETFARYIIDNYDF
ncbi:hypothetical protein BCS96_10275 [Vibrio breoganii]|uniref:capsular polysaccharide synthesis protein n=1 Tax=Vibrio breoganii TaxID=553239 RepID=UPI000C836AD6|nr:capsular polysaccharide synthesis protein [Vibrio breoganii]PMO99177.1 hypothetical protein BCS96_10275 [Vibrio breoganii]